jgi:hypothetical protein
MYALNAPYAVDRPVARRRRRCKQKRAARESLERAAVLFEEIGASLWAARAQAELARVGLRGNIHELTATEEGRPG